MLGNQVLHPGPSAPNDIWGTYLILTPTPGYTYKHTNYNNQVHKHSILLQ